MSGARARCDGASYVGIATVLAACELIILCKYGHPRPQVKCKYTVGANGVVAAGIGAASVRHRTLVDVGAGPSPVEQMCMSIAQPGL